MKPAEYVKAGLLDRKGDQEVQWPSREYQAADHVRRRDVIRNKSHEGAGEDEGGDQDVKDQAPFPQLRACTEWSRKNNRHHPKPGHCQPKWIDLRKTSPPNGRKAEEDVKRNGGHKYAKRDRAPSRKRLLRVPHDRSLLQPNPTSSQSR